MPTFLFKTEPGTFSYSDLVAKKAAVWGGVKNPAALIHLRSARKLDHVLIYHTGDERAIVGLAQITSNPYEDPAALGMTPKGEPKFAVVDLRPVRVAAAPVTLEQMKSDQRFSGFDLLRLPRLSVMPVPTKVERAIFQLAGWKDA